VKNNKTKKIQISLLILGFSLIVLTYIVYPWVQKKTDLVFKETKKEEFKKIKEEDETADTSLTNVEYKGLHSEGNPYIIKSKTAEIDPEEPDIVHMKFVTAKFYYTDGRIITITSNKGQFNKFSGDISFQNDIKMIDNQENKLTSENLDMFVSKNHVEAYNDVKLTTYSGQFVVADKILFDSITKAFKISMFSKDDNIKMKLIK
tara:strand:+ start:537 stop:1148 length:612 start_codon:yes stop_codon:yes gene_type:complete